MGKYNLVTIRPKGFIHASAFSEVKDSLAWSLAELGHEVMLTENAWAHQGMNILFGAELLSPTSSIPDNTIIFNMEQPSHPKMDNVRRISTGHTVWDIYPGNVRDWQRLGIKAFHLPIGYTPNLSRIPACQTQDIDVFFAGWMTARRIKIISDLRAAGLKVYASECCYGGYRDQIISRSKICLNIHADGRDWFEIVRVSYLMANGKCVLAETSADDCDHADLLRGLCFSDTEEIVERSKELIAHPDAITVWEHASEAILARNFTASVDAALEGKSSSMASLSPDKIRNRYESGLASGDMKDFLPLLRGLAKGEILEIGVRDGASTSALLLGLQEKGGHLTSVDIEDCSQLWTHEQWTFCQLDSKNAMFPAHRFDMAFIDGDHSPEGFLADLEKCMSLWVRPGGIILCHDISPLPNYTNEARGGDWPSQYVGEAFFDYVKKHKLRHFVYPGAWGMGVILK